MRRHTTAMDLDEPVWQGSSSNSLDQAMDIDPKYTPPQKQPIGSDYDARNEQSPLNRGSTSQRPLTQRAALTDTPQVKNTSVKDAREQKQAEKLAALILAPDASTRNNASRRQTKGKGKEEASVNESDYTANEETENWAESSGSTSRNGREISQSDGKTGQKLVYHNHNYHPPQSYQQEARSWLSSDVPHTLLAYVRFLFTSVIALLSLAIISTIIRTIYVDVADKVHTYSQEVREEIYACSQNYAQAHCGTPQVIPFSMQFCEGWKACMERDPNVIGRAKVGAETFAEVVNSFVDSISWKTMVFLLAVLAVCLYSTNSAVKQTGLVHSTENRNFIPLQQQKEMYGLPSPHPYHPHQFQPDFSQRSTEVSNRQQNSNSVTNLQSRKKWYAVF